MTFDQKNKRSDELRVGIAIARNEFDLVEKLDEKELADALRHDARELEYPHLLLAVADALDNPEAEFRLRLVRSGRGRPKANNSEMHSRCASFVEWRVRHADIPLKAAVMDAMEQFDCSRATVFRALKRHHYLKRALAQ